MLLNRLIAFNISAHLVCYRGIHVGLRTDSINTETTGEGAGLRKQLGKKNRASEESGLDQNGRTESGGWCERRF